MTKTKHSKMGKRLIAAIKEVVDHVEGRTKLSAVCAYKDTPRPWSTWL